MLPLLLCCAVLSTSCTPSPPLVQFQLERPQISPDLLSCLPNPERPAIKPDQADAGRLLADQKAAADDCRARLDQVRALVTAPIAAPAGPTPTAP